MAVGGSPWGSERAQRLVLGEQRPGDARVLVGDGNERSVVAAARLQLEDPARHAVLVSRGTMQHGAGALHQQVSEVGIATLADMPQAGLAAGGVLSPHDPAPGGALPAVLYPP